VPGGESNHDPPEEFEVDRGKGGDHAGVAGSPLHGAGYHIAGEITWRIEHNLEGRFGPYVDFGHVGSLSLVSWEN